MLLGAGSNSGAERKILGSSSLKCLEVKCMNGEREASTA